MASQDDGTPRDRSSLQMSDVEIATFLGQMTRVHVGTVNRDGSVHLVPMAYLIWQEMVALWTDPHSQKVANLRRDPRLTCLVEHGARFEALAAVQIRGRAEIITDEHTSRKAGEMLFTRTRPGGLDDHLRAEVNALASQRVLVVVHPKTVLSWDHRKLSGVDHLEIGH